MAHPGLRPRRLSGPFLGAPNSNVSHPLAVPANAKTRHQGISPGGGVAGFRAGIAPARLPDPMGRRDVRAGGRRRLRQQSSLVPTTDSPEALSPRLDLSRAITTSEPENDLESCEIPSLGDRPRLVSEAVGCFHARRPVHLPAHAGFDAPDVVVPGCRKPRVRIGDLLGQLLVPSSGEPSSWGELPI